MSQTSKLRDSGLRKMGDVRADVNDYVKAVKHGGAIQAQLTYGCWLYARHLRGNKAQVAVFGPGGGFCWRDTMSEVGLRNRLTDATGADCEARRGPPSEVWPL